MKVAGIIYLHEITQTRMAGTAIRNLEMFKKLCGNDALANVVLGTTKWGELRPEVGQKREKQLAESFWKDMIQRGSIMMQVHNDASSAWRIVHHILANISIDFVLIQDELVEHRKSLSQTTAGQMLRYTMEELLEQRQKIAKEENGAIPDAWFHQRLSQNRKSIHSALDQMSKLRVPWGSKMKRYLGF